MAKAYCAFCGSVFEADPVVRAEGEERRVQLRPLVCTTCNRQSALHSDDFAPEVITLMARGPIVAAAVIESYTANLTGADNYSVDDSYLRDQLADLSSRGLIALMIAAVAAFIANSRANLDAKLDINQVIEQVFGWKATSTNSEVNRRDTHDGHVETNAGHAERGTGKKDGQRTTHRRAPAQKKNM